MATNTKASENNNNDKTLSQESLTQFYKTVREFSHTLAEPLQIEHSCRAASDRRLCHSVYA